LSASDVTVNSLTSLFGVYCNNVTTDIVQIPNGSNPIAITDPLVTCGLATGTGDGSTYDTFNLGINSWNSTGFVCTENGNNACNVVISHRTGDIDTRGNMTAESLNVEFIVSGAIDCTGNAVVGDGLTITGGSIEIFDIEGGVSFVQYNPTAVSSPVVEIGIAAGAGNNAQFDNFNLGIYNPYSTGFVSTQEGNKVCNVIVNHQTGDIFTKGYINTNTIYTGNAHALFNTQSPSSGDQFMNNYSNQLTIGNYLQRLGLNGAAYSVSQHGTGNENIIINSGGNSGQCLPNSNSI
jgi:hypothetical protein